jgi:hypothetical protein
MRKSASVGRVGVVGSVVLLLICASAPAMAACNLNGAWAGSYTDDTGDFGPVTLTFFNSTSTSFNMNALIVSSDGSSFTETPSGTINGSTLSWSYSVPGQGSQTGSGTIASDCNHISGTATTISAIDPTPIHASFNLTRTPVTLSVGSVTFQQTAIGVGSAAQGLTLTNSGTSTLSLGAAGVDGDFRLATFAGGIQANDRTHAAAPSCGTSVAPGASCSIGVTCNPTGPGIRTGNLYINDPNKSPIGTVSLTCSGVQPLAGANFLPVSGWWWDSKLNGTGFFVEYGGKSGTGMFVGGFLYDASGNSAWLVSTGPISSATYNSSWLKVTGGQTLTGPYKAPSNTPVANVSIKFVDANDAVLTRPDGSQVNLVRFSFSATNTPAPPVGGAPQSGWWWAGQQSSGTGYGIEIQGSAVFIVAYVYDASGNPIWYLATGGLTSPTAYSGTWNIYAGGPQLTSPEGTYVAHTVDGSAVNMTLTFQDSTHGTLTMGSTVIPIVRLQEF